MKCYVDDDVDSNLLLRLGIQQGHEFVSPRSIGLRGARDATHLAHAVRHQLPLLTGNTGDFAALHDLALALQGQHYGILLVYAERAGRRPFGAVQIVRALMRLESERVPLSNSLIVLNRYR